MFKDFMEDHNTGTFTPKKYYDIDGYYRRKLEKKMKEGLKKVGHSERTVFNDEEIRRLEMQEASEKEKEEAVLPLKRSMEGGMILISDCNDLWLLKSIYEKQRTARTTKGGFTNVQ